jgi:hypothetical protein
MLTYYGVPCSANTLDLPWNPPNPEPDGSDPFAWATPEPEELEPGVDAAMVLITRPGEDEWGLELLARTTTPTRHLAEQIAAEEAVRVPVFPIGGEWSDREPPWLVVVDEAGHSLWQAIIEIPDAPHEGGDEIAPVAMVVPLPPEARAVEVRGWDAATKIRVVGSAGVPEVTGLVTDIADGATLEPDDEVLIAFESGDSDGDRLRFTLLYTPDGEHWQVVRGPFEENEVGVPVGDLPSGAAPAFRVVAFDGWSAGEATLAAPELSAPRNAPNVLIRASEPRRYPLQATVRLEAAAFDLEDRALPGGAIRWASSADGELGTGGEIAIRTLSAGRHTITASATDSDGLTGSAKYELEVDGSVVEAVPAAELQAGIDGVFDRLGRGLEPAPAIDPHPDVIWLPLGIVGAVALGFVALIAVRCFRPGLATRGPNSKVPLPPELPIMASNVESSTPAETARDRILSSKIAKDVTSGKEEGADAGSSDVTLKGSKIQEN